MNATRHGAWIMAAVAFPVMATLSGCGQAPAQSKSEAKALPAVTVGRPVPQEVVDFEEFTGHVEAAVRVGIQAMVTGYLKKINFKDGEDTAADEVLFEIDPSVFQATFNKSKAALEQAKAHAERVNSDFERGKELLAKNATSKEDYEKLRGDRLEAIAAVGMAQSQLDQDRVNLEYTKVKSPIAGRTSRRLIDAGNMVKANETMLTWVYQIDPMYGYFDVDEQTVIKLRRLINEGKVKSYREGRLEVQVGLADEEGYSLKAHIDWVDSVLDSSTGTQKMRAVINQPRDKSDQPMVLVSPGMFVRVKLPTSIPRSVLLISEKAVGSDQGEKYVLVVNSEKKIERRNIKLGQLHSGLRVVEPDLSGKTKPLQATDLVVISGLQRVRPDDMVSAKEVPMPGHVR